MGAFELREAMDHGAENPIRFHCAVLMVAVIEKVNRFGECRDRKHAAVRGSNGRLDHLEPLRFGKPVEFAPVCRQIHCRNTAAYRKAHAAGNAIVVDGFVRAERRRNDRHHAPEHALGHFFLYLLDIRRFVRQDGGRCKSLVQNRGKEHCRMAKILHSALLETSPKIGSNKAGWET